ncbi:MAG: type III-A CRISPR-associated protein Csm2 [Candidatus Desulfofervidaceae bacterium]|nr:type III-A CRISPR-associated protein Csm2 [Candidatus Desulfofervidaceae bacterium]
MKHNHGSQQYNRRESNIKLPIAFFADEKKTILRPSLLSDEAKKLSDFFVENKKDKMSIHQLRKYYNHILIIKQRIEVKEEKDQEIEFKRQLPYIKMLKAQAAYAKARGRVSKNFKTFIDEQIKEVNNLKDFNAFCDLFEAIVAFAVGDRRYK